MDEGGSLKKVKGDAQNMENIIECVTRRYRVQTPGGMIVEVESDKPLSTQLNAKLLEEEKDINEFFKRRRILAVRQIVRSSPNQQKSSLEPPIIIGKDGSLSPRQRLNQLLKMPGEFTRQDYIQRLFDNFQYKINKWTSHNDIQDALYLNKIEIKEDRKGKRGRKYRVIDTQEIEESLYKKLLQDRKLQISTLA